MKRVWLFLAHVRALSGNELEFGTGSEVLVQCLVPESAIGLALERLDSFLAEQKFARYDLSVARRYDPSDPSEDYPTAHLKSDILIAAQTGRPMFGTFFASAESASFQKDKKQHRH